MSLAEILLSRCIDHINELGITAKQQNDKVRLSFRNGNREMPVNEAAQVIETRWQRFKKSGHSIRRLLREEWAEQSYLI
jgi:cysteine sulfinate desulfinase/cysteine desulfurase-like protein